MNTDIHKALEYVREEMRPIPSSLLASAEAAEAAGLLVKVRESMWGPLYAATDKGRKALGSSYATIARAMETIRAVWPEAEHWTSSDVTRVTAPGADRPAFLAHVQLEHDFDAEVDRALVRLAG